jgi:hypothetical protein
MPIKLYGNKNFFFFQTKYKKFNSIIICKKNKNINAVFNA